MIQVKAPAQWLPANYFFARKIFLAGGISNCLNWQSLFTYVLEPQPDTLVLINPRRDEDIDRTDRVVSEEQISWEYVRLRQANEIVFWFPDSSVCPIALFELGGALERNQRVYVGCSTKYDRIVDLEIQIARANAN